MARRKKRPAFTKVAAGKNQCFFCQNKAKPDYKETKNLGRFLSERGKIVPRGRSGACAKHQRALARQIKRARFLALLPFESKVR